jgi:hypothetical protein
VQKKLASHNQNPMKKNPQKPKIKNHTPHHYWIAKQKKHQTLEINHS